MFNPKQKLVGLVILAFGIGDTHNMKLIFI